MVKVMNTQGKIIIHVSPQKDHRVAPIVVK